MEKITFLFLVLITSQCIVAKVYERCELAKELNKMPEVIKEHVPIWVCIAYYESKFDTSAFGNHSGNWSWFHGIFQLSDRYWCGRYGRGRACDMSCELLRDEDIHDDMKCAKIIFEKSRGPLTADGFKAWSSYSICKGHRADRFVTGCLN